MKQKIALMCILVLSVTMCLAADNEKAQTVPSSAKVSVPEQPSSLKKAQTTETVEPATVPEQPKPTTAVARSVTVPYQVAAAPQPRMNPRTPPPPADFRRPGPRGHYNPPHQDWRDHRYGRHYPGFLDFRVYHYPIIIPYPVPTPYPVYYPRRDLGVCVVYGGSDIVGSSFANSLREQVRESPSLVLVNTVEQAQLELYVVSADQDQDNPGANSAVSVSYVWFPGSRFLTAQMLFVGSSSVTDAAASVVSYADALMEQNR